ncbi:hypothetical protein FJY71_08350 [candidate division WOR-3 bacterium]|nr:hypothetical protein [candidate division WOR-3 bacterium]
MKRIADCRLKTADWRTGLVLGIAAAALCAGCATGTQGVRASAEPASQAPVAPPAARPAEPPPRHDVSMPPPPVEYLPEPGQVTEPVPGGVIDWGGRIVRATGSGVADPGITNPAQARLMAERAAVVNAQRNLLEIVKGVRVNSDTKVENFMTRYDVVNSAVEGTVMGARQVGPAQWDSVRGLAQVEMEMNLVGPQSLAEAMAPVLERQGGEVGPQLTPEVQAFFQQYSGLVIEARDSTLKPALCPRIYDEDGNLLLDTEQALAGTGRAGRAAVHYVRQLDEILNRPEFARQPLVLRLRQIQGRLGADIVLSRQDADKLRWLKDGARFLLDAGRLIVKLVL